VDNRASRLVLLHCSWEDQDRHKMGIGWDGMGWDAAKREERAIQVRYLRKCTLPSPPISWYFSLVGG